MANDEMNKNGSSDLLGLESNSLDALDALDNISTDDMPKADIDTSDAKEFRKLNEDSLKLDLGDGEEENAAAEDVPLKDFITDDKTEPEHKDEPKEAEQDADGEKEAEQGADGEKEAEQGADGEKGAERPERSRTERDRRRPDARRRPDGRRRPDADGRRRPAGAAGGAKRPRPRPEGQGEDKKRKKKGWTKKKKAMLITITTIVLSLILIVGIVLFLFFRYTGLLNRDPDTTVNSGEMPIDSSELVSKPDTIDEKTQEEKLREMLAKRSTPISDENVMNILLVGEDLRDTEEESRGRTDAQLLVSINKQSKKIVLASFLRDSYIYLDNYGNTRLNAAYYHEGINLLENTISKYYNVKIDRYLIVNFYSFIEVVETIGGVDMDVDKDESFAMESALRQQNRLLNNPENKDYPRKTGMLHLNGNQALAYARVREGCGDDYGRTQRQREMITAIINKVKQLNIVELDDLITKVAPQITTDLTNGEIASLMLNASEIASYQICQIQMPTFPYFKEEVIRRMAVIVPDYEKNALLLKEMIYGDSTTSEQAVQKLESGQLTTQPQQQDGNNGDNTLDNNTAQTTTSQQNNYQNQNMAVNSKKNLPDLNKAS